MKNRKILGIMIAAAVITAGALGSVSSQAENASLEPTVVANDMIEYEEFDQPDEGMDISDTKIQEACLLETLSDSEFQAMMQDKNIQMYGAKATVNPDKYEPNDSREQAFQYDKTTKMSGNVFTEGYTSANCHEEGNEDWFELGMGWGYKYDVVLKNLYRQDRHIYIWGNPNGYWEKWGVPNPQTGMPEKFVFSCKANGRYFIQIVGGGPESYHFFFAAERQGTINTALWPSEVLSSESKQ